MTGVAECLKCGGPVDPRDPNMLVEVVGFHRLRTDGGQNHVLDRKQTGRVLCGECGLRLRHGVDAGQLELGAPS